VNVVFYLSIFIGSFNKALNCSQGAGIAQWAQWLVYKAGQPGNRGSFSGRWTFFCSPKRADEAQVSTRGHSLGREADYSPKSSKELKNSRSCTYIPPFAFMVWTGTTSAGGISVESYWGVCGMKDIGLSRSGKLGLTETGKNHGKVDSLSQWL
jgi:hypothetical protein